MFVIGMELDIKVLKYKASDEAIKSHIIVIPFALGIELSYFIVYDKFACSELGQLLLVCLWGILYEYHGFSCFGQD
jgi:Kef-type K+ transport system membrane component KefB